MTANSLGVRIIPGGMVDLSASLLAYARDCQDKLLPGERAPAWVSTALAMANLLDTATDPIYIPVTAEMLDEANKVQADEAQPWAREAIISAADKDEMFLVSRAFLDEYVALLERSQMKAIHRTLRLQAVQVMIDAGRAKRAKAPAELPAALGMGPVPPGPWIPVSHRTPTAEDANAAGDVFWLRSGIKMLGRVCRGVPVDATHWCPAADVKPKEPERVHASNN